MRVIIEEFLVRQTAAVINDGQLEQLSQVMAEHASITVRPIPEKDCGRMPRCT